eukprot:gene9265-9076_t
MPLAHYLQAGSLIWPCLLLLHLGVAGQHGRYLLVLPDSVSAADWRALMLAKRVRDGDKQAFDLLVAKYQRRLMRLLSRIVHDQSEAEDVVQETFIKAYRALRHFRGESAFYTWLYRIGINTAKNFLATQGRRTPTSTEIDAEQAESMGEGEQLRDMNTPESMLASKQIAQTVNAAMDALPLDLRTAIALREIEGLSYEEISAIMACPIGTVRSRIFRAREVIANKLRPLLDMPTRMREQLSALADGELDESERELALAALATPDGQRHWRAYHLLGDVLRAHAGRAPDAQAEASLLAGLAQRLADEPAYVRGAIKAAAGSASVAAPDDADTQ